MNLRPVRTVTVGAILVTALLAFPSTSPAAPVDDLRAQAEALEANLNANGAEIAAIGEQLDSVQARIDDAKANIREAEDNIAAAEDEINRLRDLLAKQAAALYVAAGSSNPLDAIHVDDVTEASARSQYSAVTSERDDQLIAELDAAQADLEAQKAAEVEARETADAERDELQATLDEAQAAADEQQGLLDQVQGELAEELRRMTIEAAANAPQVTDNGDGGTGGTPSTADGSGGTPSGPPPMGSGGAGAAASYAQAQVGKAYCNTNPQRFGPTCFDCSGLTYSSWQAGGLTIPAVSGSQGAAYPHVPLSQLQPGDLITTTSWGAHVGIWVGGGYVHATNHSNNPNAVRFVGGSGTVIDAVRPS